MLDKLKGISLFKKKDNKNTDAKAKIVKNLYNKFLNPKFLN